MTMAFDHQAMRFDDLTTLAIIALDTTLKPWDTARLRRYKELWNYYEGYHWEYIPYEDKPQVTINYCRKFVDKYCAFLLGSQGFTLNVDTTMEDRTLPFLNEVWDDNDKMVLSLKMAQTGSVSGDVYLRVYYQRPGAFDDPFGEFPKGKLQVISMPSHIVFPIWDSHDRTKMIECQIKYPVFKNYPTVTNVLGFTNNVRWEQVIYRQIWTKENFQVWEGAELIQEGDNPYGFIPVVHIQNYPIANSNYGLSDLEDAVPMNIELNEKMSDISEIIDYHSSPITIVKGAKIGQLEKGANKVWGNLPKDSEVHNLEMTGDLVAASNYIENMKGSMFEVVGIPESALGGLDNISNTSGVALQIMHMPLIERTRLKRIMYGNGLQLVNKMILAMAVREGLIDKPSPNEVKTFYKTEIVWSDALPKDELLELQEIQLEMELELESKRGAITRINNGHEGQVDEKIQEIQEEKMETFKEQLAQQKMTQDVLGVEQPASSNSKTDNTPKNAKGQPRKVNAGFKNSQTPSPTSNNSASKAGKILQPTMASMIEGKVYNDQ